MTADPMDASSLRDQFLSSTAQMDLSAETFLRASPSLDQAIRDLSGPEAAAVVTATISKRERPTRQALAAAQPSARVTVAELLARRNLNPADRAELEAMAAAPRITREQLCSLVGLHRRIMWTKPV